MPKNFLPKESKTEKKSINQKSQFNLGKVSNSAKKPKNSLTSLIQKFIPFQKNDQNLNKTKPYFKLNKTSNPSSKNFPKENQNNLQVENKADKNFTHSKKETWKNSPNQNPNDKFLIFRPKKSDLQKAQNSDKINQNSKLFHLGQKNLGQILLEYKTDIWQIWAQNTNLFFKKIKILQNPNRLVFITTLTILVILLIYISFFDVHFLIKNYQISFTKGSYLGQLERQIILDKFSQTKILGVFPVNQFWFVNDRNLTLLSQNAVPEVLGIQILGRNWPNKISIQITTAPILLTLETLENGQTKRWRVLVDGRILTQDEAGLQQDLVIVERAINFDQKNFSLQEYPIFSDNGQLNRLYFAINLWSWLKELKLEVAQTILPSLNIADKDVTIILQNGTKLYFDSSRFSAQTQKDRLQSILQSQIGTELKNGELAYIDFRISKKVFVCPKSEKCEKETLQTEKSPKTEKLEEKVKT